VILSFAWPPPEEAIARYGCPEIFNTDQGSQFTSNASTAVLKSHDIKISMDGRGRYMDNIFIERLWWTVKYHYVYLHTFENGPELRKGLSSRYLFQIYHIIIAKYYYWLYFSSR
jgi:putative transposase